MVDLISHPLETLASRLDEARVRKSATLSADGENLLAVLAAVTRNRDERRFLVRETLPALYSITNLYLRKHPEEVGGAGRLSRNLLATFEDEWLTAALNANPVALFIVSALDERLSSIDQADAVAGLDRWFFLSTFRQVVVETPSADAEVLVDDLRAKLAALSEGVADDTHVFWEATVEARDFLADVESRFF